MEWHVNKPNLKRAILIRPEYRVEVGVTYNEYQQSARWIVSKIEPQGYTDSARGLCHSLELAINLATAVAELM